MEIIILHTILINVYFVVLTPTHMGNIILQLAGIDLNLHIKNQATEKFFYNFTRSGKVITDKPDAFLLDIGPVCDERLFQEEKKLNNNSAFAEYSLLLEQTANPLLRFDRFFFHGASFIWNGKAYIFTGKSGVGKTTMLKHWMDLYPEEIEIINGDKPIIELKNSVFTVYPSPWTGKEGWSGNRPADLAGIICLEQGKENRFFRLNKKDAVFPVFLQFLYISSDKESVDLVCDYERELITNVPVWKYINDGSMNAAKLLYNSLGLETL